MDKPFTLAAYAPPDIQDDVTTALSIMKAQAEVAARRGAQLLLFPECYLQGFTKDESVARSRAYDLESDQFVDQVLRPLKDCELVLVFGLIEINNGNLFNTALVVKNGAVVGSYRKQNIHPSEHVFSAGSSSPVFEVNGFKFGINICYDAQFAKTAAQLAEQGVDCILYPLNNMHPINTAKQWRHRHLELLMERAKQTRAWVVSSDVTGTRESLISYGPTAVLNPGGKLVDRVPELQTGLVVATITKS